MKRRFKRFFTHYVVPRVLAYGGKALLKLLTLTCRIHVEGMEEFLAHAGKESCILLLWHNRLMLVSTVFLKHAPHCTYTAFISQSRDGEPLALFTNSHKNGRSIRVRHNAKHEALKEMIDRLKKSQDVLIVTPDGPRGPRYEVKPGVAVAAQETGAKIFTFSWSADRFWQLNSWDQMIVPKPFATIHAVIGSPLHLSQSDTKERHSKTLEEALLGIDQESLASFKGCN
jgi:lysophospholipid acyltransferase (LPLAT)-like uncharacterized protein